MFNLLDKLRPTATGLDQLPAWFLRLAAPFFCRSLTRLFNLSFTTAVVPQQWKRAVICPVPKVAAPTTHTDFRPISVTPVLTRIMEKAVVRKYLYPSYLAPPETCTLTDQFAFRPTGSTTAALISILHSVTSLLTTNSYVIVIALDFSKAFDTVRHSTLLQKLAQYNLPDNVFNWIHDFFQDHSHCTTFNKQTSSFLKITASIFQGSAIGPAMYVVNASDLKAVTPGNLLCKYADDTYLIIPECNAESRILELQNIENWSKLNNFMLNRSKSVEVIFSDKRCKRSVSPLPPIASITQNNS